MSLWTLLDALTDYRWWTCVWRGHQPMRKGEGRELYTVCAHCGRRSRGIRIDAPTK